MKRINENKMNEEIDLSNVKMNGIEGLPGTSSFSIGTDSEKNLENVFYKSKPYFKKWMKSFLYDKDCGRFLVERPDGKKNFVDFGGHVLLKNWVNNIRYDKAKKVFVRTIEEDGQKKEFFINWQGEVIDDPEKKDDKGDEEERQEGKKAGEETVKKDGKEHAYSGEKEQGEKKEDGLKDNDADNEKDKTPAKKKVKERDGEVVYQDADRSGKTGTIMYGKGTPDGRTPTRMFGKISGRHCIEVKDLNTGKKVTKDIDPRIDDMRVKDAVFDRKTGCILLFDKKGSIAILNSNGAMITRGWKDRKDVIRISDKKMYRIDGKYFIDDKGYVLNERGERIVANLMTGKLLYDIEDYEIWKEKLRKGIYVPEPEYGKWKKERKRNKEI